MRRHGSDDPHRRQRFFYDTEVCLDFINYKSDTYRGWQNMPFILRIPVTGCAIEAHTLEIGPSRVRALPLGVTFLKKWVVLGF